MDYVKAFGDALDRREELQQKQAELARNISGLQAELAKVQRELMALEKVVDGLQVMASDETEPPGLTDYIRRAIAQTTVPLGALQLRTAAQQIGIPASSPKNLLINIHTILTRLSKAGEIIEVQTDSGRAYRAPNEQERMFKQVKEGLAAIRTDNLTAALAKKAKEKN